MDKLTSKTMDLEKENIELMKKLFPSIVKEGKINFEQLRLLLGDEVDDSREKYQLMWKGKAAAIKLAQTPSSATLRPAKDKSKCWEETQNIYIEGDNLEVLKQLQKTYYGKVKLIYIDPPYNTGTNLIYKNDFYKNVDDYLEFTNQRDENGNLHVSNPSSSGRFHSDWLDMMYSRLLLSRNLIKDDGFIAIAIDENEVATLTVICDEIFGEINRIGLIAVVHKPEGRNQAKFFGPSHEYMLVYVKNVKKAKLRKVVLDDELAKDFNLSDEKGNYKLKNFIRMSDGKYSLRENKPDFYYCVYVSKDLKTFSLESFPDSYEVYPITDAGQERTWKTTKGTLMERFNNGSLIAKLENGKVKIYEKLREEQVIKTHWINKKYHGFHFGTKIVDNLLGIKSFDFPKSLYLMKDIVKLFTEKEDIILDFFSGSGTTGHAVIKQNIEDGFKRKFILVQLPEKIGEKTEAYKNGFRTIPEIAEMRLDRAGNVETNESMDLSSSDNTNVDIGFKVFKLDSTNINPWDNDNILNNQTIFDNYQEVFKFDRTKEDILYEVMLKYGIFDQETSEIEINGKQMYVVGKNYMLVCLENEVNNLDIDEICKLKPRCVVFKESGFKNDNDKINAVYNLEKAGIEDIKCI